MKFLAFVYLNILLTLSGHAQSDNIEGLWYSGDSTRIYQITKSNNQYRATLYTSKRNTEKPGTAVISALEASHNGSEYRGVIHALDDGTTTALKITTAENGRALKLKLKRLFIFPLKLVWYKVDN